MMRRKGNIYFHWRKASGNTPAGLTVSKYPHLPVGDFGITEYFWGSTILWFVDADEFTADERQTAYLARLSLPYRPYK